MNAFFDIETGGFDSSKYPVFMVCYLGDDSPEVQSFSIGDDMTEADVIRESINRLYSYDAIYSWNGSSFDVPYLNKRAKRYGLSFEPSNHIDLRTYVMINHKPSSSSLDGFAKSINVEAEKTPFSLTTWRSAMLGDKTAMDYILEHCIQDVIVLKQIHERIFGNDDK